MKQTINAELAEVNNHCGKKVRPEHAFAFEDNEQLACSHTQSGAGSLAEWAIVIHTSLHHTLGDKSSCRRVWMALLANFF